MELAEKMTEGSQEQSEGLTPEELARLEGQIPAFRRRRKIRARGKLTRGTRGSGISPAGGMASKLNPLNPQDREWGEPTVPIKSEDIKPPSKS